MATARDFQPIPKLITAEPELDTSAQLIALLDATLDHHRALVALAAAVPGARRGYGAMLKIDPAIVPHAEHVLRLWASARNFKLIDLTSKYAPDSRHPHGSTIRAVTIEDDADELVRMQWPVAANPAPLAVEVTALAVRDALRAPHWTDDKTLSDEERAARERMEGGHA